MCKTDRTQWIAMFALLLAALSFLPGPEAAAAAPAQAAPAAQPSDPGWPRTFTKDGTTVVMHQPQIDAWKDYQTIRFRAALEVTPQGAREPSYGVVAVEANTDVVHETNTVVMTDLQAAVRFPGLPDADAAALKALVRQALPKQSTLTLSLDRVLAYMHDAPPPKGVDLGLDPPLIYYSDTPAILVVYLGQPDFKPVQGTKLMFAVNTNWVVILDMQSAQYYLLDGSSWLTASDPVKGNWVAASSLPDEFQKIPSDASWEEVRKNVPGKPARVGPRVLVSTEPAELIVTNGTPGYSSIAGTTLMYVNNPELPVFLDLKDLHYYYLVAGRWFRAMNLTGPWSAASKDLPAEFARIPSDSPMAYVLPSVPGTQEAKDAVLLASVPHKATIKTDAKLDVVYHGTPQFVPIQGTSMKYAVNTSEEVVLADTQYYCCQRGVWFMSPAATGPWVVCTSVPAVIYTIPPSCPIYNVTYVRVYSSTPTTVVVGYTGGYSGEFVDTTGTLMFGAGMATGMLVATSAYWYWGCPPCYYSYGCAPYYHYGYGGYCAGAAWYGPYGGAGRYAAYNPATGFYSRGGYAYGPYGAAGYRQAYNPWTDTYAAHAGGVSGYGSWGASTVSRGDQWASAGHVTGPDGVTRAAAADSSGQWAEGVHGNQGTIGRASNGDIYAGHDGNVYRRTSDGQWQTYQNGSWDNMLKSSGSTNPESRASTTQQATATAEQRTTTAEQRTTTPQERTQNSWQNEWRNNFNNSSWQNRWENARQTTGDSGENRWSQHDMQNNLNSNAWSRGLGNSNNAWRGGGGGGFGGGGWGGGGGFRGGFRR